MDINSIAVKYYMDPFEDFIKVNAGTETKETLSIMWYTTLLEQTDHIPNKMTESFFETMSGLSVATFLSEMFGFIKNVYLEYKPILDARAFCRREINRLEKEAAFNGI